jgi:hypothetical protein
MTAVLQARRERRRFHLNLMIFHQQLAKLERGLRKLKVNTAISHEIKRFRSTR